MPIDTNLGISSMSGGCATPWGSGLVYENWVPDARQFETMATTGERPGSGSASLAALAPP